MNNALKFIIVVSIALLSTDIVYQQGSKSYGQGVNNNNGRIDNKSLLDNGYDVKRL